MAEIDPFKKPTQKQFYLRGSAAEKQLADEFRDVRATVLAKSSSGGKYKVSFTVGKTTVKVHCDCPAGSRLQLCYHKVKLSAGCEDMLFDSYQRELLLKVLSWPQCKYLKGIAQAIEDAANEIEDPYRLRKDLQIIKETFLLAMTDGIGAWNGKWLLERLLQTPSREQMDSRAEHEIQFLGELGFSASKLATRETAGQLLMRVLRPLDYAIAQTIDRTAEIPEEHIRKIQIALAHWSYCLHLPRYGPYSAPNELVFNNIPYRELTNPERMAVLTLIERVVPPSVFLSLNVNGIESFKCQLDERIRSSIGT